jgi:hypothetical protein
VPYGQRLHAVHAHFLSKKKTTTWDAFPCTPAVLDAAASLTVKVVSEVVSLEQPNQLQPTVPLIKN